MAVKLSLSPSPELSSIALAGPDRGVDSVRGRQKETKSGSTQPADATLSVQTDRVEWQSGSTGIWTTLTATQTVHSQDAVRTDVRGSAVLDFYTGTQADIQPDSEVTLSSFEQTAVGGAVVTL